MSRNSCMDTKVFVQLDTSAFPNADASKKLLCYLEQEENI
jgi:hypothetical protein